MLRTLLALTMLVAASVGTTEAGEIYRWKDANGVTHFSDRKPVDRAVEQVVIPQHRDEQADALGTVGRNPAKAPSASTEAPASKPPTPRAIARDILMYDDPKCGYCRKAERWFKSNGVAFRSLDITASKHNRDSYLRAGGRGTPLIFVDGKAVNGFNEERLRLLVFGR